YWIGRVLQSDDDSVPERHAETVRFEKRGHTQRSEHEERVVLVVVDLAALSGIQGVFERELVEAVCSPDCCDGFGVCEARHIDPQADIGFFWWQVREVAHLHLLEQRRAESAC